jgi:hypothetical protein
MSNQNTDGLGSLGTPPNQTFNSADLNKYYPNTLGTAVNEPAPAPELTYGQKQVGADFNVSGSNNVYTIKMLTSTLIDELNRQRDIAKIENNSEKIAQYTLAIRAAEDASMRGVKAATWKY